jgi:hypothetical protein
MSLLPQVGGRDACADLSRFRTACYRCVSARADAFFELTDALLCADGATRTPVELSLPAEHQRGYSSLYGALNHGRNGRSSDHVVPGRPYSFVAALTPDRSPPASRRGQQMTTAQDDCSTLNKQADDTDDLPAPAAAGIAETAGRVLAMAVGAASPSRPGDTAEIEAITDAMIRLLSGASGGGHRGISP